MSEYVAAYGARASIIVAVEHYTQQVTTEEGRVLRPRMLVGDFAIVKAAGRIGWAGFRDVVEVNGEPVADRRDRLLGLLTGPAGGWSRSATGRTSRARERYGSFRKTERWCAPGCECGTSRTC